jgi:hypothetical protein
MLQKFDIAYFQVLMKGPFKSTAWLSLFCTWTCMEEVVEKKLIDRVTMSICSALTSCQALESQESYSSTCLLTWRVVAL